MNPIYEIGDHTNVIDLRNIEIIYYVSNNIHIQFISGNEFTIWILDSETESNFLGTYLNLITTWKQFNENKN